MGGTRVTTQTEVPGAQGRNMGQGSAVDGYGKTIEVWNADKRPVPPNKRCIVQHAAGGRWVIVQVEE